MATTVGLGWVSWRVSDNKTLQTFDLGIGALAGSLAGGRLVYVVAHWGYFSAHIWEIPQLQLGGFAWPGAFAGWALGAILACSLMREPTGKSLEVLMPLAAVLMVSAWMGCWVDGCAYGFVTDHWWALPARDEWGIVSRRVPVQVLGALWTILLFWLFEVGKYWKKSSAWLAHLGSRVALTSLGLSLGMLGLSFLRGDPAPVWRELRLESWAAMVIIAVSLLLVIAYRLFPLRNGHDEPRRERRRLEAG